MEKSGYGKDGVYRSLWPPIVFPNDPNLSLASFLFQKSDAYPNRLALAEASSGENLNFAQFKALVQRACNGLARLGIRKGDVVLIFAPNSIHFPVCFLAIVALGAVATTVNPLYTTAEITKQVNDAKPKLIFTVPHLWAKVKHLGLPAVFLGSQISEDVKIASISGTLDFTVISFSNMIKLGGHVSEFPHVPIKQSDVAVLLYSSGTTGSSKGVVLTHRNIISTACMIAADENVDGDGQEVILCFLPMFHVFCLVVIRYSQLMLGNSVISMEKFDMEMVFRSVEKFRVTYMYVLPPVMTVLAKQSWRLKFDLSSLKRIGSGAAPIGKEVMEECARNYPHTFVLQGYGLTESCGVVSIGNPSGLWKYGSSGFLLSGVEAMVVDLEKLSPLPPDHRRYGFEDQI